MHFEFATATRIAFGSGSIREAIGAAASMGRRALIVSGKTPERLDPIIGKLKAQNVQCTVFAMKGEPTIPDVLEGVRAAKGTGCDVVIGCGGGSALDAAKAIAAFLTNPGDPLDYLEVVGLGKPLERACAPCICVPTTAGTGCEVTRNSVLLSPEHGVKVSLRSPRMFPLLAAVDPDLTITMPPPVTGSTGMDALTQLIEPLTSNRANPFTDALCRDGIRRAALWLRAAYHEGGNREARENMALTSLFGGLSLANAGLGVVHGIAAPLGGMVSIPHGIVCARLLPFAMDANIRALSARLKESPAIRRYDEIACLLTGKDSANAWEGVDWIRSMCSELSVPPLSSFGLTEEDLPGIVAKAQNSSSIKGNPIQLTSDELVTLLRQAL
jgi:alcohol dehydrogenase class IV